MLVRRGADEQTFQPLRRTEQHVQRRIEADVGVALFQSETGPREERPGDVAPIGIAALGVLEQAVGETIPFDMIGSVVERRPRGRPFVEGIEDEVGLGVVVLGNVFQLRVVDDATISARPD